MIHLRPPKEIQKECLEIEEIIREAKAKHQEHLDRLEKQKRLLDAQLILSLEYWNE